MQFVHVGRACNPIVSHVDHPVVPMLSAATACGPAYLVAFDLTAAAGVAAVTDA